MPDIHHRLVRLVLKVRLPSRPELRERPAIHLLELSLRRPHLNTSFNAISGKRSSTIDIPLVEDLVLSLLITTDKVIKALDMRLSTEGGEGQIVILEVKANARKVNERLDADFTQLFWVTNTRALQDKRRAERAAANDHLLTSPVNTRLLLSRGERFSRADFDAHGTVAFENHLLALGVADEVEVLVHGACAVYVCVRGV